ncbi:AMP deaminase [Desmophyllum pertusum]|uniref:AMP deaminase n=1 Tax=Desmophyllum pertusum TaxID=174260 RepID=A0A9X0D5Z1_9CNID|nr:AMP deaminase [Desmophyllum pertusum]
MLVNCTIISEKRNDDMIAFLLSESSMFVSRERLILKTCGQTTLLHCIKPLLELAKVECGLTEVQDFFYSRMKLPRTQPSTGTSSNIPTRGTYILFTTSYQE